MGGTLMSVAVALAVVTEVGWGAVRCDGGMAYRKRSRFVQLLGGLG